MINGTHNFPTKIFSFSSYGVGEKKAAAQTAIEPPQLKVKIPPIHVPHTWGIQATAAQVAVAKN